MFSLLFAMEIEKKKKIIHWVIMLSGSIYKILETAHLHVHVPFPTNFLLRAK